MDPSAPETREIPPLDQLESRFFGAAPAQTVVDYGAASHGGKVRANNDDHYVVMQRRRSQSVLLSNFSDPPAVDEDAYAFAVADGMGGEVFGNLASRLALQTGLDLGHQEIKWPMKIDEREAAEVQEKLEVYLRLMDRALIRHGHANPEAAGMGTTFTVVYTSGLQAFVGHVGDSRAYRVHGGRLIRLTRDHTLAQEMLDSGEIKPGSIEFRRTSHVLTNCLGGPSAGVFVDTHHFELDSGDRLLLCTDGLTDMVDDDAILSSLLDHSSSQAAVDALVGLALDGGGKDNITAVVAGFLKEEKKESEHAISD